MKKYLKAFGWSWRAWSYTFFQLDRSLLKDLLSCDGKVLEIGSSHLSQLGIIFEKAKLIELGFWDQDEKTLNYLNQFLKKKFSGNKRILVNQKNFNNVNGKYDLIIMKSVLGGVFKINETSILDLKKGIYDLITKNLNKGGYLITLDNGFGFIHKLTENYGARAKSWRFLENKDLYNPYLVDQVKFGFFSSFTFQTRIPIFGNMLDSIIFFFDKLIFKIKPLKKFSSSIVVSVYKNIVLE